MGRPKKSKRKGTVFENTYVWGSGWIFNANELLLIHHVNSTIDENLWLASGRFKLSYCKYIFIVALHKNQQDLGWTTFSNKNSTGTDFFHPPPVQHQQGNHL